MRKFTITLPFYDRFLSVTRFVFVIKSIPDGKTERNDLMKVTNVKVCGIWLEPTWAVVGTRGSFGSCLLKFDFSSEWDGMRKRVTFFPADGSDAVETWLENGEALIPDEVMSAAGSAVFVIDGERDGVRYVSTRGELRVIDTAAPGGKNPLVTELREQLAALRAEYEKLKER